MFLFFFLLFCVFFLFFFFQAEDGIRDFCLSRGLGDVYKRQGMSEADRKQIQSEIFLDINDNTKKVAANVLTHIEMLKDPFSDIGLARRVIEKLNKQRVFLNRFELSSLDEEKIKVSSIIKFAMRYLVTIKPADGKTSLYAYWDGNKEALQKKDESALNAYIEFCAKQIDIYFSSVKDVFKAAWNDPQSKILSVIAINGFIIALNRQPVSYTHMTLPTNREV